jgi:hypothetical protein
VLVGWDKPALDTHSAHALAAYFGSVA